MCCQCPSLLLRCKASKHASVNLLRIIVITSGAARECGDCGPGNQLLMLLLSVVSSVACFCRWTSPTITLSHSNIEQGLLRGCLPPPGCCSQAAICLREDIFQVETLWGVFETGETGQFWYVSVLLGTERGECLRVHVRGDPLRMEHYLGNVLQVSSSAGLRWALWRKFKEVSAI